jgi:predicted naringenin-chalcone synthase
MAKIISVATALPAYKHTQQHLLNFMTGAYEAGDREKRILNYLYQHSGIDARYSVIPDFTLPIDKWEFFPKSRNLEPFPTLEYRMKWFGEHALPLSVESAEKCLAGLINKDEITHLITVSCTGMSAPGLELQVLSALGLRTNIYRTAINFMGCYAAVHGLKMANDIITANTDAKVLIICTELCSLHFQKTFTDDTITAPLLFGDGSAAALVCGDSDPHRGLHLHSFYAEVMNGARDAMTWNLGSNGFKMTLSADVPELFREDIGPLKERALAKSGITQEAIKYWCIHPGGKRILQAIAAGLSITDEDLAASYGVLKNHGNMSSPTILFVLKAMWDEVLKYPGSPIFAAAFGPGLTMESLILTVPETN